MYREVLLAADSEMPPLRAHTLASEYAQNRGAVLIRGVSETTRKRVNLVVSEGLKEGKSVGQIAKELRADNVFSKERSTMIARTETAISQGQGAKAAAHEQGKTEKRWVTQRDAEVEEACRSNESDGWIPINAAFSSGVDVVPQHPGCRCAALFRNPPLVTDGLRILAEVRCPACRKLVGRYGIAGSPQRCTRCKRDFEAGG